MTTAQSPFTTCGGSHDRYSIRRCAPSVWSIGVTLGTAAVIVGYFASGGVQRIVAGLFAAIILPIAFAAILIRQLGGSRPEACILAAFACWSVFECLVVLALWLFGVRLSSTAVGIPNAGVLVALLLLIVPRALIACKTSVFPRARLRLRPLLWLSVPAALLVAAALVSVKSESRFYNRGDALAISFTSLQNGRSSRITVVNPTSQAQEVPVIAILSGPTGRGQTYARSVPANGSVALTTLTPSSQVLTATLYQRGAKLGSVRLRVGGAVR